MFVGIFADLLRLAIGRLIGCVSRSTWRSLCHFWRLSPHRTPESSGVEASEGRLCGDPTQERSNTKSAQTREACTSIGGSQGNLADLRSVLSWKSPPKTPCKGSVVTDNHRSIARRSNRAKNRTKDIVFARELEKHGGVKTVEMRNLRFQLR